MTVVQKEISQQENDDISEMREFVNIFAYSFRKPNYTLRLSVLY